MTYHVQGTKALYDAAAEGDGGAFTDLVADYLDAAEQDGWTLVSVVPAHDAVFIPETEEVRGYWQKTTAMLVMHKETPGISRILA